MHRLHRVALALLLFGCREASEPGPAPSPTPAPVEFVNVEPEPKPPELAAASEALVPGPLSCTGTIETELRCEIERSALEDTTRIVSEARFVPQQEAGNPSGVALFAIRSGSLPNRLGLVNGDVILAIDDHSLGDLDTLVAAWPELSADQELVLRWRRDTSEHLTTLILVDALSAPPRDLGTASPRAVPVELGDCEATQTTCELEATGLRAALAGARARCVPKFTNDEFIGMELHGIRSGSLESELGLRNGDQIVALAGEAVNRELRCSAIFDAFRESERVTLRIRRRDQTIDRTYVLD
ncbi:hypothetical protein ACNOYE_38530 [Nannocystaceae bacterium ST9]